MTILANQNEHAANTAERLESYARRIAALEAELATEHKKRGGLSGLVITAHMTCFPSYVYTDDQTSLDLLTAEVTTLRMELATERARLDWLELHGATVELMEGGYWRVEWGGGATEGETARAAIDAAMKGSAGFVRRV